MEMVKLVKGDRVIERRKIDYENNKNIWGIRGWGLYVAKPKPEPKPEPKPKVEKPKEETLVRPTIRENESAENFQERLKNYEEAVSKKTKKAK